MADPPREPINRSLNEEQLREAVIDYLSEHPQAADTLQGIAEWWVLRQQVRVDLADLEGVLRQLSEQGLLEEVESSSGRLYRLKSRNSTARNPREDR